MLNTVKATLPTEFGIGRANGGVGQQHLHAAQRRVVAKLAADSLQGLRRIPEALIVVPAEVERAGRIEHVAGVATQVEHIVGSVERIDGHRSLQRIRAGCPSVLHMIRVDVDAVPKAVGGSGAGLEGHDPIVVAGVGAVQQTVQAAQLVHAEPFGRTGVHVGQIGVQDAIGRDEIIGVAGNDIEQIG